ncbi:MAG TPA: hypothetical protein H9730_09535 [Candidatus Mediterraneibacter stercoripullorum]|nr:hypothetical protein [Candidatus Mediterraneibacter stercoripullorum]
MFGNGKNAEDRRKEKDRKKRGARKYGQARYKHSHGGVVSCWCGGAALVILAGCILYAYLMRGNTLGIVGGIMVLPCILSLAGVVASVKGLRERERNYLTCRIGLPVCAVVLLLFCAIFIGGIG